MALIRRQFVAGLLLACAEVAHAQEEAANFFSGYVVELSAEKLSVERSVMGQPPEIRSFMLTPKTEIEGKLQVKARVTVRFAASDQGEVATHIIVRSGSKTSSL